ncbi:MAG: peptidoglycan DD-metalloendopeptidase family protein [Candidatus Gracilibacteria bacterium]|nr:peptidoglycan DD-metalloendopeptidase family protein [Candidatus Gracilibacteria bacterium]
MKLTGKFCKLYAAFSLLLALFLGNTLFSYAEETAGDWILEQEVSAEAESIEPEAVAEAVSSSSYSNALESARKKLFEAYFETKVELKTSEMRNEELGSKLETVDQRVASLTNALDKLDENINELEDRINKLENNVKKKKIQVTAAMRGIRKKEDDIKFLEETLGEIVKKIYYKSDQSSLEILLNNETFSEAVNDLDSLNILEEEGSLLYTELQNSKIELQDKKEEHKQKKESLEKVKQDLQDKQTELQTIELSKTELLEAVRVKEDAYTAELEMLELEHNFIEDRANYLYQNLVELGLKSKLDRLEAEFGEKYLASDAEMIWPVDPAYKGISAFYEDPGYFKRFGVVHRAIDIPEPTGTPIRAAADGIVSQAKDPEDTSYNVIFLIHSDNLMTAYGHVSESLVEEGELVRQGDVIGLTGGMPGTLGAGRMTTGPHLHFEVRQDGQAVDPLTYLP